MTRMCDLSPDLVREIFARVPITSLRVVRSTCKLWNALCKDWIFGKVAAREQFLGFMTMNSKVCSLRLNLQRIREDLVGISTKQIDKNHHEISKVFHCDGLMLCVTKDNLSLLVWNPYLGQTRWIEPKRNFNGFDNYALGYDNNRNHKILKFSENDQVYVEYEIYDFSSNSWRVLSVTRDWRIKLHQRSVSLKGKTYFVVHEKISESANFLLCFDFVRERFGHPLSLPFHSYCFETVTLSCVREEQLAVLYQKMESVYEIMEI